MSEAEIRVLFDKVVNDKELMNKSEFTKHQKYNWRNKRSAIKLGTMLEVLYRLEQIQLDKV